MPDDSLHQPHDKLFKAGFENPATARSFFEQHLPPEVFHAIDWKSLTLEKTSFISPEMRGSESDLLFSAKLRGQQETSACLLYILWEHSGRENRLALLNLLFYMALIWKRHVERHPQTRNLPPILPVLLAQNNRKWDIPAQFRQLFADAEITGAALDRFLVDFRAQIIQLANLGMGEIRGTPECVMVLRAMKVAVTGDWHNALLWDERLLMQLGEEMLKRLIFYVVTLSDIDKNEMRRIFSRIENKELRSKSMSVAEQFIEEGRQEGLLKGRQEGLLKGRQEGLLKGRQEGLLKGRQEGLLKGRQEGEWIGKIQLMEQFLGRELTPRKEFEGRGVEWLEARFRDLEAEYNAKIKGR